ncbi:amidohydrolase family protein [Streptomyces sp. NBC_01808]|uniref:amidohydrolase family protein n=1 Tax=Streptomyces sp. NBC_01808 TaxID=2975947 RepID=UPI002DD7C733|nr:amidohydrolase family protein [Streptomyces sp. NBC_01808]WSA36305.1 amidohydrolase family protein [Streptomyces sp. NBC_01808]
MTDRVTITGVRVFDGRRLSEPRSVVIADGVIGTGHDDTGRSGGDVVTADGGVLLPGLIDAHVHLGGRQTPERLCSYGVTTALDMSSYPPQRMAALREVPRGADVRSAGTPAIGPGGLHARIPTMPADAVVTHPGQAEPFVAARLAEGSDYIKIIADPGDGGPDQRTVTALVGAAHARSVRVVVHATSRDAVLQALDADADVITHLPLGTPLDRPVVDRLAADGCVVVPTLTMMEGIAAGIGRPETFAGTSRSVALLQQAGVPVVAGTDTNDTACVPFQPEGGISLHHELELLVDAGLRAAEALHAATGLAAQAFGLTDRGSVEAGLRADLVLIDGDPLADIRATRNIRRIWCGGVERAPAGRHPDSEEREPERPPADDRGTHARVREEG